MKGCERTSKVEIKINSMATEIDFANTRVKVRPTTEPTAEGTWQSADVIVAADGVKSFVRTAVMEEIKVEDGIETTGQAAYRILLTRDQMEHDPELLELIEKPISHRWIGEKRHIIVGAFSQPAATSRNFAHFSC